MTDRDKDAPRPPEDEADPGIQTEEALEKQFYEGEERTLGELKEEAQRATGSREGGQGAAAEDWVEGEEELRRLMTPKKSARHPILALLVIGASLYGMWWLRDDMRYILRPGTPVDLGQATDAIQRSRLEHNTYVTLQGMPLSQSVASHPMRSLLGGSSEKRKQWLILTGTGHQVVVSQPVSPVDPRSLPLPPKSAGEIQGTFTGRLRLLRRTEYDARVRSDYLRLSKESLMLRPFHRVAGAEILAQAGRPGATLKDVEGESFRVDADTLLEIFVTFPGEYELDIHTDQKDEIKRDLVKGEKIPPLVVLGGDGAPTCGPALPWPLPATDLTVPGAAPPSGVAPRPGPGAAPVARPQEGPGAGPAARPGPGPAPAARPGPGPAPAAPPTGSGAGAVVSGDSPRTRRAGWGGSVFLRYDPQVFLLDHLPRDRTLLAPAGRPGEPPQSGADRVIAVPPGTQVYNAKPRDCKQACRWEGPACLQGCSAAPHLEITPVGKQVFLAAGGDCGGGQGERHEVNLSVLPFPDARRAEAFVESLGHPYLLTEDLSRTSRMVRFIVKLPEAAARELTVRQRQSSPYNIAPRFEVFRVRWQHLGRRGEDLLITRTVRGYPPEHDVEVKEGKRRLRPVPIGATLRIAAARVVKADITQLLRLPKDTYLLEVGVRPNDMWMQPFVPGVPVFYLLFLIFIVLNLAAIRSHFRK